MRAAFMQSPFKSVATNSSKLILVQFYSTKQNVRSSSKNHYDTLKITPYATQTEVKSAYYKLTLQYHPDKNKSEYAKQKFQDISDAYEVLSNYELRKNYDRQLMIRQPIPDIQEPISRYRDNVYSGSSKIYNFDAWTQAHYGRQFQEFRMRKNMYENYKKMEELHHRQWAVPNYIEIALFLLTLVLIAICFQPTYDIPASKNNNDKCIQENEIAGN